MPAARMRVSYQARSLWAHRAVDRAIEELGDPETRSSPLRREPTAGSRLAGLCHDESRHGHDGSVNDVCAHQSVSSTRPHDFARRDYALTTGI